MPSLVHPVVSLPVWKGDQPTLPLASGMFLRPLRHADSDAVLEAFTDPEICQWHAVRMDSLAEARAWVVEAMALGPEKPQWAMAPWQGPLVGWVGFHGINTFAAQMEIGYWVLPQYRNRGLVTQAVTTLVEWAFGIGFRRIVLGHSTANAASGRVAEKAGFTQEALMRRSQQHPDGFHDMAWWARLAPCVE